MTDQRASLWGLFEITLDGPTSGNPYLDVELAARFSLGDRVVNVPGFYDGEGIYRIRFLPDQIGEWRYNTTSNAAKLDDVSGTVEVGPAQAGNHGPVRADGLHFRHADGTRFINIGTTAYVWNLQGDALEEQTLATLANAPFTKIRMCVFPKHYRYNQNEPERYPFAMLKQGSSNWPAKIEDAGWAFDFDRPDPAYFHHLEKRIGQLAEIGVQADLIVLHPYDRWGFSRMAAEQDDRYLRYLVARLAAFPNVWWSMANEYDFMANKTLDDWNRMIEVVAKADPFGHLLSIHNGFAPFDYTHPRITHVSIQRQDTARALQWRQMYNKPISDDECSYEGDISEDWGNIGGQEMVHRFWAGTVNGGYVTHGETYNNDTETIWWAKGGKLVGQSPKRIAFLRRILEEGPDKGLEPMPHTGHYRITMGGGLDVVTLPELTRPMPGEEDWKRVGIHYATAGQAHQYYLSYFGVNQPGEASVVVPPDEHYRATLIDTWEMTETEIAPDVVRGDVLHFPAKPFQAFLLRRTDATPLEKQNDNHNRPMGYFRIAPFGTIRWQPLSRR
ncbi:DUF5060 domain-containing protein [Devosia rhodophyticola]|uniref:DUF5060 domain-containing protein n=1 Tax=Devosia rhodophyticola TaxID=3026423 RepID=A0ABY7YYC6_9HYPH|nr:DUF5060 domain-containing protein [Devosia rhodophyticola]WDR06010.1 DUF5060 domain-containing protein [Devosia rhodophyticola]